MSITVHFSDCLVESEKQCGMWLVEYEEHMYSIDISVYYDVQFILFNYIKCLCIIVYRRLLLLFNDLIIIILIVYHSYSTYYISSVITECM